MPVLKTIWRRRPLLALVVLILLLVVGYAGKAITSHDGSSGAPKATSSSAVAGSVPLSTLPREVTTTVRLILKKGPYPFKHDGIVYQNLERQLPPEPKGYYHEYTVVTPGSTDRGERRVVTGQGGEFYYTANHYASFVRFDPAR